jgi:hypothetical protein
MLRGSKCNCFGAIELPSKASTLELLIQIRIESYLDMSPRKLTDLFQIIKGKQISDGYPLFCHHLVL